jgi:hypothetical protein
MTKTFAQQLNDAKNMLAGLAAHADQIAKRGISVESLINANALYDLVSRLQNERNALKSRSQEATVQAEQLMTELESLCSEAKKEFPKETWPEFGFRKGECAQTRGQNVTTPNDDSQTAELSEKSA